MDDNYYLTAPTPLGPWKVASHFAPIGTNTFNSQTFQGLEVPGRVFGFFNDDFHEQRGVYYVAIISSVRREQLPLDARSHPRLLLLLHHH